MALFYGGFSRVCHRSEEGSLVWYVFHREAMVGTGRVCVLLCPRLTVTLICIAVYVPAALAAVREACALFRADPDHVPAAVAHKFGLKEADAKRWYSGVNITACLLYTSDAADE